MNIVLSFDPAGVERSVLAGLYERVSLGKREPGQLKRAFENSFMVCFAFDGAQLVGAGRMISDGEYYANIYDVAVSPECQGKGVGNMIMRALLEKQGIEFILLTSTVGKEPFYRKLGFRRHKTAMAIYRGSKKERAGIYLSEEV